MENKYLVKVIEALGARICDLEVALRWKEIENEDLKKKIAEKEAADGKN